MTTNTDTKHGCGDNLTFDAKHPINVCTKKKKKSSYFFPFSFSLELEISIRSNYECIQTTIGLVRNQSIMESQVRLLVLP